MGKCLSRVPSRSPQLTLLGPLHPSRPVSAGCCPANLFVNAPCEASDPAPGRPTGTEWQSSHCRSSGRQSAGPWSCWSTTTGGFSDRPRNGPSPSATISQWCSQKARPPGSEQSAARIPAQHQRSKSEPCYEEASAWSSLLSFSSSTHLAPIPPHFPRSSQPDFRREPGRRRYVYVLRSADDDTRY